MVELQTSPYAKESSLSLRGIAILLLLIGHFAIMCIEGFQPFEYTGEYAVIMFLVLSGLGLSARYGFASINWTFYSSRIKKLILPVWITLILFYLLDYYLSDRSHSILKICLSFIGIINQDPPNGPDWFISYILFLYFTYMAASKFQSVTVRLTSLFLMSYSSMILIMTIQPLDYFKMWIKYPLVFPLAVLIGINKEKIFRHLYRVYHKSKTLYIGLTALSLGLYKLNFGFNVIVGLHDSAVYQNLILSLRTIYLSIFTVMAAALFDKLRFKFKPLVLLGTYSMELFLLHYPFMVYYDFFLFREPLSVFFVLYGSVIFLLAVVLKNTCSGLYRTIFK